MSEEKRHGQAVCKRRIDTYEKMVSFASNKIEVTNKIPFLLLERQFFHKVLSVHGNIGKWVLSTSPSRIIT